MEAGGRAQMRLATHVAESLCRGASKTSPQRDGCSVLTGDPRTLRAKPLAANPQEELGSPGNWSLQGVIPQTRIGKCQDLHWDACTCPCSRHRALKNGNPTALLARRAGSGREVLASRPLCPSAAPPWGRPGSAFPFLSLEPEPASPVPALQHQGHSGSATVNLGTHTGKTQTPRD